MKKLSHILVVCLTVFFISNCSAKESPHKEPAKISAAEAAKLDTAYFASGCFWCVEETYQRVKGVKEAISGYSGGTKPNPTYKMVGSGSTNYAESVEVLYNPDIISYKDLLTVYFSSQDPTQVNGQGPDIGRQYRSIIFYQNAKEKKIAENYKKMLNESGKYDKPIAAEITKFTKFYKAEDYHQEYFTNHPNNPYIIHESKPRVQRFMEKHPELLKAKYK